MSMRRQSHQMLSVSWLVLLALLLVWAVCVAGTPVSAAPYTVHSVPNFRTTDAFGYVANPDKILAPGSVVALNANLKRLEEETGAEVAVVVIKNIGRKDSREFANELFALWGIGKKATDNGLLILIVTEGEQRSIVFETGYGLEHILPDAVCYRIQQESMIPDAKNNNFDIAAQKGVIAVASRISRAVQAEKTPHEANTLQGHEVRGVDGPRDSVPQQSEVRLVEKKGSSHSSFYISDFWVLLLLFFVYRWFMKKRQRNGGKSGKTSGRGGFDSHSGWSSGGSSSRSSSSSSRSFGGSSSGGSSSGGYSGGSSGGGGARSKF